MDKSMIPFLPLEATDENDPSLLPYKKEINESPETRARCLEELRKEIMNIKNIDPCLDDSFLVMFLRASKFDIQKALQRMLIYYQQCDVLLHAFLNCSLSLQRAQSFNHLFFSPYRLKDNSFLLMATNNTLDYRKCTFAERFYLEVITVHQLLIENPINQMCGVTCIFDLDGFNTHSFLACTPGWMRTFVSFTLNAVPGRVKAVYLVNSPPIFASIFNIVNPLLSKKIRDRVFIHSRNDGWLKLHASIPAEILPKQFGGEISDDQMINYMQDVQKMQEKFLKTFAFGSLKHQSKRKSMKVIC